MVGVLLVKVIPVFEKMFSDFGGTLPSGTVDFAADEISKVVTIDVAGDGINAGSNNVIKNSSNHTIIAGEDGIEVAGGGDILNTGAITALNGIGIDAGDDIARG